MTKLWIALGAAVLLAASRTKPVPAATAVDPGSCVIAIYVKSFPPEARRLSLRLESIAAQREDGATVPLRLTMSTLSGDAPSGQRLLAWGAVPAGNYTGFAIATAEASIKDDDAARKLTIAGGVGARRVSVQGGGASRSPCAGGARWPRIVGCGERVRAHVRPHDALEPRHRARGSRGQPGHERGRAV
jgi:hypothetical protein